MLVLAIVLEMLVSYVSSVCSLNQALNIIIIIIQELRSFMLFTFGGGTGQKEEKTNASDNERHDE